MEQVNEIVFPGDVIELQPVLDIPDYKAPENMASVKILSATGMKMRLQ